MASTITAIDTLRDAIDSELFTALCVWEEWLERTAESGERHEGMSLFRDANGAAACRAECGPLARFCDSVYELIPEDDRDGFAFDWEIIPLILEHGVTWTARQASQGEPAATARKVTELLRIRFLVSLCQQFGKAAYRWDDFTDGEAEAAMRAGQSPREFIEAMAERYDLDSVASLSFGRVPPETTWPAYDKRFVAP